MSDYQHTHLRMNNQRGNLKGSPLRDLFKQLHKSLPHHMFGCDVDFALVEKNPDYIVAFFDIKRTGEAVTFSEVIAYNDLLNVAPLYLLYTDSEESLETGRFLIKQYQGGNRGPNPPIIKAHECGRISSWREFAVWEQEVRTTSKAKRMNPNG